MRLETLHSKQEQEQAQQSGAPQNRQRLSRQVIRVSPVQLIEPEEGSDFELRELAINLLDHDKAFRMRLPNGLSSSQLGRVEIVALGDQRTVGYLARSADVTATGPQHEREHQHRYEHQRHLIDASVVMPHAAIENMGALFWASKAEDESDQMLDNQSLDNLMVEGRIAPADLQQYQRFCNHLLNTLKGGSDRPERVFESANSRIPVGLVELEFFNQLDLRPVQVLSVVLNCLNMSHMFEHPRAEAVCQAWLFESFDSVNAAHNTEHFIAGLQTLVRVCRAALWADYTVSNGGAVRSVPGLLKQIVAMAIPTLPHANARNDGQFSPETTLTLNALCDEIINSAARDAGRDQAADTIVASLVRLSLIQRLPHSAMNLLTRAMEVNAVDGLAALFTGRFRELTLKSISPTQGGFEPAPRTHTFISLVGDDVSAYRYHSKSKSYEAVQALTSALTRDWGKWQVASELLSDRGRRLCRDLARDGDHQTIDYFVKIAGKDFVFKANAIVETVFHGQAQTLVYFIDSGFVVDWRGLLRCAASSNRQGHMACARLLLEHGVPVSGDEYSKNGERTPLVAAVEQPSIEVIDLLVEFGADVSELSAGSFGVARAPLECAVWRESTAAAERLIYHAINASDQGMQERFFGQITPRLMSKMVDNKMCTVASMLVANSFEHGFHDQLFDDHVVQSVLSYFAVESSWSVWYRPIAEEGLDERRAFIALILSHKPDFFANVPVSSAAKVLSNLCCFISIAGAKDTLRLLLAHAPFNSNAVKRHKVAYDLRGLSRGRKTPLGHYKQTTKKRASTDLITLLSPSLTGW